MSNLSHEERIALAEAYLADGAIIQGVWRKPKNDGG